MLRLFSVSGKYYKRANSCYIEQKSQLDENDVVESSISKITRSFGKTVNYKYLVLFYFLNMSQKDHVWSVDGERMVFSVLNAFNHRFTTQLD